MQGQFNRGNKDGESRGSLCFQGTQDPRTTVMTPKVPLIQLGMAVAQGLWCSRFWSLTLVVVSVPKRPWRHTESWSTPAAAPRECRCQLVVFKVKAGHLPSGHLTLPSNNSHSVLGRSPWDSHQDVILNPSRKFWVYRWGLFPLGRAWGPPKRDIQADQTACHCL